MTIKKGTTTIAVDGSPNWGSIEGNLSEQTDLYNALNAKAPSLSPSFTGTPTAPTANDGTVSNQIATTEFVNTAINNIDTLPDQTDMEGKYLATDGVNAYWKSPAGLPLLSFIWSDHILNDASLLKADTFSWQSGAVYKSAYAHLVEDYTDTGSTHTDTVGGVSVTYKLCADGHKICEPSQMQNIEDFYDANGSAWYYILDTENNRFKLPRTLYGFTGTDEVVAGIRSQDVSGVIDSENVVKEKSNEMFLYFYVGNTIRNETEIDVGQIFEALSDKLNQDLSNANPTFKNLIMGYCMPDYSAGTSAPTSNTTAIYDCYVKGDTTSGTQSEIFINDVSVARGYEGFVCAFVPSGSTFRVSGVTNGKVYPLKGSQNA